MNEGKISQIIGVAIDVDFSEGELPEIYNAVEVPKPDGTKLVLEVQQHLGEDRVRCISMDSTDGLVRGTKAYDTGSPITSKGCLKLKVTGVRGKGDDYGYTTHD